MYVQMQVSIYFIFLAFLIVFFSWAFERIDNTPLVENGMQIIHAGIESKYK
jgi:hypothetical protein